MEYKIRTAVPADEGKIRELFLEMLRTIYHTDDVKKLREQRPGQILEQKPGRDLCGGRR